MPDSTVKMPLFSTLAALAALALSPAVTAREAATPSSQSTIEAAIAAENFHEAVRLARAGLNQSPRNPKLWTLEAIALSRLGEAKEAVSAYDHALEIAPDYLPALEGAAELEYNTGNSRALVLLDRIVHLSPNNRTAHAMLGVLAYKRHDCVQAVKHFDASREAISAQPAALAEYGSCLVDLGRPDGAQPVFENLLRLEPRDAHTRYNLAVVQLARHHAQDAIQTLEPLVDNARPDPDVLDLASSAYEETGDTPTAVKLLRQAIVLNPNEVRYYVDFATISFAHQSFEVGVDMMNLGLKENPDAAPLYVARGVLYIQLGEFDKGEADFASANRLDPRQTSASVAEGLAELERSNPDRALSTVRSQIETHPRDAFLAYLEAQILFERGAEPGTSEFSEAVRAANRSLDLRPDFVLASDLLGNLYLKSGEIAKSIVQSRRALRKNPSDQEALYHLIQALRKAKDRKAQEELPGLVKRLAGLRAESRNAEAAANRYKLYEPPVNAEK
ncbi:MAG: tetratricopeptide repeat protein [Acidobacteria bacterium]|nr:tetratricopeptide repeat protein [Acidobacteriota bacterium]